MIVNLGGNDMLRGIDPAASRANLDAMLTKAQGAEPARAAGGPARAWQLRPGIQSRFRCHVSRTCAPNSASTSPRTISCPLIDQTTRLLSPDLMQADGLHPNAKGVIVVVKSLARKCLDLLAKVKK